MNGGAIKATFKHTSSGKTPSSSSPHRETQGRRRPLQGQDVAHSIPGCLVASSLARGWRGNENYEPSRANHPTPRNVKDAESSFHPARV